MPTRPPVHRPSWHKTDQQKRKEHDIKRGTAHERGYGHKWRKARLLHLQEHPLCVECLGLTPSIVEAATVVDHIVPHKGDLKLFWNRRNWQSLCKRHHDIKTMKEGSFGG